MIDFAIKVIEPVGKFVLRALQSRQTKPKAPPANITYYASERR